MCPCVCIRSCPWRKSLQLHSPGAGVERPRSLLSGCRWRSDIRTESLQHMPLRTRVSATHVHLYSESATRYKEQTVTREPSQTFCLDPILVTPQEDSSRQHHFVHSRTLTSWLPGQRSIHFLGWAASPFPRGLFGVRQRLQKAPFNLSVNLLTRRGQVIGYTDMIMGNCDQMAALVS